MRKKPSLLQQLYVYEELGKLVSIEDAASRVTTEDPSYQNWLASKRSFSADELSEQHWIKTCVGGYITELIFHEGGALEEYTLFARSKAVGEWQVVDGVIHTKIDSGNNSYTLAVVANKEVNIHSAIELKNNDIEAYLKLAQTRPVA